MQVKLFGYTLSLIKDKPSITIKVDDKQFRDALKAARDRIDDDDLIYGIRADYLMSKVTIDEVEEICNKILHTNGLSAVSAQIVRDHFLVKVDTTNAHSKPVIGVTPPASRCIVCGCLKHRQEYPYDGLCGHCTVTEGLLKSNQE